MLALYRRELELDREVLPALRANDTKKLLYLLRRERALRARADRLLASLGADVCVYGPLEAA